MKQFVRFLAVVLVVTFAAVAWGENCPPVDVHVALADQSQTWWMVLLSALVQLTAPLLVMVISVLGTIGLRKWFAKLEKDGKKVDIETQNAIFAALNGLVTGGVSFAEEQARKALRNGAVQTTGAAKMQAAVDFVMENLNSAGLPDIGRDALQRLIESRLAQERAAPDGVVSWTPPEVKADPLPDSAQ